MDLKRARRVVEMMHCLRQYLKYANFIQEEIGLIANSKVFPLAKEE